MTTTFSVHFFILAPGLVGVFKGGPFTCLRFLEWQVTPSFLLPEI